MKRLRWTARGLSLLVAGVWLFVSVGHAVFELPAWMFEEQMMTGLTVASLLSILVAWWRGGIGGTFLLICGAAHSTLAVFASGHNKLGAVLISGGPFLLLGALFLAAWRQGRSS